VAAALEHYRIEELESLFESWGCKASHAAPLVRAYYATGAFPAQGVLALPSALRQRLIDSPTALSTTVDTRDVSSDGTVKLLLRLHDGGTVESVMIPDLAGRRVAGCISSQVGCSMQCDFCATTKTGFERNLSAGEMVAQFLALRREADAADQRLQTVVFMGMGEPLLNVDEVLEAVRRIADNRYGGLGWRQVTISTVGIVPGIEKLTEAGLAFHLAVSLHAPDDMTRAKLLPTGKRYTINEILRAADLFQARRGRPVTIQYCLLRGINDSLDQARQLAALVGRRRMHVNLLTYNPTGTSLRGIDYEPSTPEQADAFHAVLREAGIVTHFRKSRGPDIDAACGQLRHRHASPPETSS
jgi:23S rRNA (adenine2503-C2)-methyltransferase